MKMHLIDNDEILKEIMYLADIEYSADSFGGRWQVNNVHINIDSPRYGYHFHDNMKLAYSNAIAHLDDHWIDATIHGIGRGAGNVKLEDLLLYLEDKNYDKVKNLELPVKLVNNHKKCYMYTGKNSIHPNYVFKNLDIPENKLLSFLKAIPKEDYSNYNPNVKLNLDDYEFLIPARYKSTRFPGKPLAKINGKEMILHVYENCNAISKALILADQILYDKYYSNKILYDGFNDLDLWIVDCNCLTGTDRCKEYLSSNGIFTAEKYVLVQGDEPLLTSDILRNAIMKSMKYNDEIIQFYTDYKLSDEEIPRVVVGEDGYLLYASRADIPGQKIGANKEVKQYKQVCLTIITKDALLRYPDKKSPLEEIEDVEVLRFLEAGEKVRMIYLPGINTKSVDEPGDIKIVEDILNGKS